MGGGGGGGELLFTPVVCVIQTSPLWHHLDYLLPHDLPVMNGGLVAGTRRNWPQHADSYCGRNWAIYGLVSGSG